ncbi:unnamed protein product, partial [Gadus morhua 'NCC']
AGPTGPPCPSGLTGRPAARQLLDAGLTHAAFWRGLNGHTAHNSMAPVNLVGELSSAAWSSSPVLALLSTLVFLTLSITLLTLCMRCRRNPENAYDVNMGQDVPDQGSGTKADNQAFTAWRNHGRHAEEHPGGARGQLDAPPPPPPPPPPHTHTHTHTQTHTHTHPGVTSQP